MTDESSMTRQPGESLRQYARRGVQEMTEAVKQSAGDAALWWRNTCADAASTLTAEEEAKPETEGDFEAGA